MYINRDDKRALRALFGHRVRFDEAERRLYRSDLWRAPAGVRMFTKSHPDAVVLPEDESDLANIMDFANEVSAPVVPRGGGTAMNGGSMPVVGGIVVDTSRMQERFQLGADGETVTVSAGMTLEEVAVRLAEHGRALAVEPIFPEATTVGGWLATGGPGFGSNLYGGFEKTVESVRLVLPNGERRVFSGSELDVVRGLCGSTGLIGTVTLRTREATELTPFLASFNDLVSLQAAFEEVRQAARWWTLMVETPDTAALKAEAMGERPPARNAFLLMGAMTKEESTDSATGAVKSAVEKAGGKVVDAKKTAGWWATHKEVYRAKTLGPSIVPYAMIVPTHKMPAAVSKVHEAVFAPHWMMTVLVAGDESLFIGYALDDERRPTFESAYGAALAMKKALRRLDGRPVSLGVQSADAAQSVLAPQSLERVQEFQKAVDPKGIMNPGKVFGTPMRFKPKRAPGPSLQGFLRPGEAILRGVHKSTYVKYQRREEARAAYKAGLSAALGSAGGGGFGEKWAWDILAGDMDAGLRHSSAGARAFGELGSSPLGWLHWMKQYLYTDSTFNEYQYRMIQGEGIAAEAEYKSRFGLRFADILMELKAQLVEEGFRPVREHREIAAACKEHHNMFARDNAERAAWAEGLDLKDKGQVLLFVDDAVSFEAGGFARRVARSLLDAGEPLAYLGANERSSAHVLLSTGQHDDARALVEHNIKAIAASGAKTVVTLDPWTHHVLVRVYPRLAAQWGLQWDVQVVHAFTLLAKHLKAGKLEASGQSVKVAMHHPPVFLLHGIDEEAAQRALSVLGYEAVLLAHHGKNAQDVGASGAVDKVYPEIPLLAARKVFEDASRLDVEHLVSTDPASGGLLRLAHEKLSEEELGRVPQVLLLSDEPPQGTRQEPESGSQEDSSGSDGDAEGEPEAAPEQTA
jgi:FAD/FMN-containing dehydrogenase/Fe-S oxidoreductase